MVDHKKANEYKELCAQTSDIAKGKPNVIPPSGWNLVKDGTKDFTKRDPKSNFKAVAYTNGNEIVITFAGTDPKSIKDWGANFKALNWKSVQMKQANEFYTAISEKYPTAKITLAGHSEGGTEAMFVALQNNVKAVTFNALGVEHDMLDPTKNYDDLITNYRDPHDPVSKLKELPGKTFIVESTQNKFLKTTLFGSKQAHNIDTMGDCETALDIETYKMENKFFLDYVVNAEITREDIGAMEPDLYDFYDGEIMSRMTNNDIPTKAQAHEKSLTGGTVWVEDYTRSDGTQVSGYYRRIG